MARIHIAEALSYRRRPPVNKAFFPRGLAAIDRPGQLRHVLAAMRDCLIIFGAAVRPDGSASGSLERRVIGALAAIRNPALALAQPLFVPTGGVGRHGPAEAEVIRSLLVAAGAHDDDILLEPLANDTLASVRLVHALLQRRGIAARLVMCTSAYHQPRCALLFRLLGYRVLCPPMPADRAALGWPKFLRYTLKELIAAPYDALLLLGSQLRRPH